MRAAQIILDERIAKPILLGNMAVIQRHIAKLGRKIFIRNHICRPSRLRVDF